MSEKFSFRWGIPLLDAGDTRIPNFFFDQYIEAGVTRTEFLTILHLARYQFEKPGAECRPSVETISEQMDYSTRTVQRILVGLEEKGLLKRHYRPGKTTLYDFAGFSRKILTAKLSTGATQASSPEVIHRGDTHVTPTPDTHVTPGVTPTSPEEEHQEEQSTNADDGWTDIQRQSLTILTENGADVTQTVKAVARKRTPEDVQGMLDAARRKQGLSNPIGWAIARLRDGEAPPTVTARGDDRKKYISGEYADLIQT
jgi:hypothetical protein